MSLSENPAKPLALNPNYKIAIHNDIVRGMFLSEKEPFSAQEIMLFLILCKQISDSDDCFHAYTVPTKKLAELIGLNPNSHKIYDQVKIICTSLFQRSIDVSVYDRLINPALSESEDFSLSHVLEIANRKNGIVTLKLDKSLEPYLLHLDRNYTLLFYERIKALCPNGSAIRLYCYMLGKYNQTHGSKEKWLIDLSILREKLGFQNMYSDNNLFIEKIIIPALTAINSLGTCAIFDFEIVREGNKISGISYRAVFWEDERLNPIGLTSKETLLKNIREGKFKDYPDFYQIPFEDYLSAKNAQPQEETKNE